MYEIPQIVLYLGSMFRPHRWHIIGSIWFEKNLMVIIEVLGGATAVAFYYCRTISPSTPFNFRPSRKRLSKTATEGCVGSKFRWNLFLIHICGFHRLCFGLISCWPKKQMVIFDS